MDDDVLHAAPAPAASSARAASHDRHLTRADPRTDSHPSPNAVSLKRSRGKGFSGVSKARSRSSIGG